MLFGEELDGALVARRLTREVGRRHLAGEILETYWAAWKAIEALARDGTLILAIEDLQCAQPTFLKFLEYLKARIRHWPVLIVYSARSGEMTPEAAAAAKSLSERSLALGPLASHETSLLARSLGAEQGLTTVDLRNITELAGGNPLFVEQIVAFASHSSGSIMRVPPTIHSLLVARLEQLDCQERDIVEAASVIGSTFTIGELGSLIILEDQWRQTVDQLSNKGLIARVRKRSQEGSARGGRYKFTHLLIREAAYNAIPKARRARLHETFGSWLEADGAADDGLDDERVGHHFQQAHEHLAELHTDPSPAAHLASRAGNALGRAGRAAAQRSDVPSAVDLLSRSVRLLRSGDTEKAVLEAALSGCLLEKGDWDRARRYGDHAVATAHAAGDTALAVYLSTNRLRERLLREPLYSTATFLAETAQTRDRVQALKGDQYLYKIDLLLAWGRLLGGRAREAEATVKQTIGPAKRYHDPYSIGHGRRILLGVWLYGPARADVAIEQTEHLLHGWPARRLAASAYRSLALLHAMRGDFGRARTFARKDKALLRDLGLGVLRAAAAEVYAVIELLAGEPVAAEGLLSSAVAELVEVGDHAYVGNVAAVHARALYAASRYDEAWRAAELAAMGGVRDVAAPVHARGVRGKLLTRHGSYDEGEALAREAVALADRTDFADLRGEARMDLWEVLESRRNHEEATSVARRAIALFEQKGNVVSAARARRLLAGDS